MFPYILIDDYASVEQNKRKKNRIVQTLENIIYIILMLLHHFINKVSIKVTKKYLPPFKGSTA